MKWPEEENDTKYYIDLNELYKHIQIGEEIPDGKLNVVEAIVTRDNIGEITNSTETLVHTYGGEVSSVKYDTVMRFIDYLMTVEVNQGEPGDLQELLSEDDAINKTSFANKIIINTLEHVNILKKK